MERVGVVEVVRECLMRRLGFVRVRKHFCRMRIEENGFISAYELLYMRRKQGTEDEKQARTTGIYSWESTSATIWCSGKKLSFGNS